MSQTGTTITISLDRYQELLDAFAELNELKKKAVVVALSTSRMKNIKNPRESQQNVLTTIIFKPEDKTQSSESFSPKSDEVKHLTKVGIKRLPPLKFDDGEKHCVKCFKTPEQIKRILDETPEKKRPATFVPYPPLGLSYVFCFHCGSNSKYAQSKWTPKQVEEMIEQTKMQVALKKMPPKYKEPETPSIAEKRPSPSEEHSAKRQCIEAQ